MSGTEVARLLAPEVFSLQALAECSVTGRPSSGKGKELTSLRPPLDPNGVGAIYGK